MKHMSHDQTVDILPVAIPRPDRRFADLGAFAMVQWGTAQKQHWGHLA